VYYSRNRGTKIICVITPDDAESLLFDWVNLPVHSPDSEEDFPSSRQQSALQRFRARHRYPEILSLDKSCEDYGYEPGDAILSLGRGLQDVWDTVDIRAREWKLFQLRESYHRFRVMAEPGLATLRKKAKAEEPFPGPASDELGGHLNAPPPITVFEAAVFYFQRRLLDFAKHCGNPTCPAPYFIAKKKQQKFCSSVCAEPSQRESKRKWWTDNRSKDGGLS
jgi:hypothetical protein